MRDQKIALEEALKKRLDSYDGRAALVAASEAAGNRATEAGNQAEQALAEFTEAGEAEGAAKQEVSNLTTELRSCDERSGLVEKSLEGIDGRRQAAETLLTTHFSDALPKDPAKQLAAERKELLDAQQAVEDSRQTEAEAQEKVDAVREVAGAIKAELAELDQEIAVLRTRSEQAREDLLFRLRRSQGRRDAAGASQANQGSAAPHRSASGMGRDCAFVP